MGRSGVFLSVVFVVCAIFAILYYSSDYYAQRTAGGGDTPEVSVPAPTEAPAAPAPANTAPADASAPGDAAPAPVIPSNE